jgi:LPXTG-motif cell wall-anchored protein
MRTRTLIAAGLILSLAAVAASAQSKSFTVKSKDCAGVQWSAQAVQTYPNIAKACQAVEEKDGKTFVKFEGEVEKNINKGDQIQIKFKDGGTMTVNPPENLVLVIDGRKTPLSSLKRGDDLVFRVPEDRFTAQFNDEETQQVAEAPILRVVEEEEEPQVAQNLPETATQTTWFAFAGAILLAMGASLTMRRRRNHH